MQLGETRRHVDDIEVYGEGGVTYADLHMGNALPDVQRIRLRLRG